METLNWLISAIQEQISSALSTMMGTILIWMILFFILGVVIIVFASKKKC